MVTCFIALVDKCSNFLTQDVVYFQTDFSSMRQLEAYRGYRVERVRVVLSETKLIRNIDYVAKL